MPACQRRPCASLARRTPLLFEQEGVGLWACGALLNANAARVHVPRQISNCLAIWIQAVWRPPRVCSLAFVPRLCRGPCPRVHFKSMAASSAAEALGRAWDANTVRVLLNQYQAEHIAGVRRARRRSTSAPPVWRRFPICNYCTPRRRRSGEFIGSNLSLGARAGPRGYPCGGEMGSDGPPQAPIFSDFFLFCAIFHLFSGNSAMLSRLATACRRC